MRLAEFTPAFLRQWRDQLSHQYAPATFSLSRPAPYLCKLPRHEWRVTHRGCGDSWPQKYADGETVLAPHGDPYHGDRATHGAADAGHPPGGGLMYERLRRMEMPYLF